jgi:hypothetical protein
MRSTLIMVAGPCGFGFAAPAWSMPSTTSPQHGNTSAAVLYVGDRDRDWHGDREREAGTFLSVRYITNTSVFTDMS